MSIIRNMHSVAPRLEYDSLCGTGYPTVAVSSVTELKWRYRTSRVSPRTPKNCSNRINVSKSQTVDCGVTVFTFHARTVLILFSRLAILYTYSVPRTTGNEHLQHLQLQPRLELRRAAGRVHHRGIRPATEHRRIATLRARGLPLRGPEFFGTGVFEKRNAHLDTPPMKCPRGSPPGA